MSAPSPVPMRGPQSQSGAPSLSGPDAALAGVLDLPPAALRARRAEADRLIEDDGVLAGSLRRRRQRWALDPLPVVLSAHEWADLEAGLVQRARVLDAVLTDLYGPARLLREGVIPPAVVLGHPAFVRAAINPPQPLRLTTTATDVVRAPDGGWLALSDRSQVPTGAGYAVEARRVVARVFPALYRGASMQRLRPYVDALRLALAELAPGVPEAARVVVLAPESLDQTAFDNAFLATLLGYPLATSEDLTVRDGAVHLRTLGRLERVDVIYRRVPDDVADGLELVTDSTVGVPGLIGAWRRGSVAVANPIGSGVLESPGLTPFLADAARLLLDEDLRLPMPPTWWCGTEPERRAVLDRLAELVLMPLPGPAGENGRPIDGATLSRAEREQLRARIEAEPELWCAQEGVVAQSVPLIGAQGLRQTPFTMRAFAVAEPSGFTVMAGGLGRVLGSANMARANTPVSPAKDVWVLTDSGVDAGTAAGADTGPDRPVVLAPSGELWLRPEQHSPGQAQSVGAPLAPRVAEHLFTLGANLERAETLVRLLRVVDDLTEDWATRPHTPGGRTLAVLRYSLDRTTGSQDLPLWRLVAAADLKGSIAAALATATDAATAVREQLSGDVWIVLGGLERTVAGVDEASALQPVLARLLEGLLAMAGLAVESLVRDTGWYLADAGRRLERAEGVLDLLLSALQSAPQTATAATAVPESASLEAAQINAALLDAVLVAAESVITHRRRYPGPARPATVLELLVSDRDNPRSVAMQFDRLASDLAHLPPDAATRERLDALVAIAATAREVSDLRSLRVGVREIRDALRHKHFPHLAGPRQLASSEQWGS